MKNLSDFAEKQFSDQTSSQDSLGEEDIKNTYEKYKNMSQGDLLKTLSSEVEKQKKLGTFDFQALEALVNNVAPMLSSEQLSNIKTYLNQIR